MEPTLSNGDIVLLTKTTRFVRGDLCGFTWNNKLLIKRVIGLPGDWIEIDTDGTVYLNGEKLDEPYVERMALGECDLEFPFQVPQEQYFVIGDMRENSIDSRNTLIGCIAKDQIVGKAEIGHRIAVGVEGVVHSVIGERAAQAVIQIQHGGNAVKTEAVEVVFLHPEF